jgi:hypothetical protein
MFSDVKSLRGNTCVLVFMGKYVHMEPGERNSQTGEVLRAT